MRIAPSLSLSLLLATVPSVSFAQIVVPYSPGEANHTDRLDPHHLDHALLVATVTRTGDGIALANPQQGDGFLIGDATLDLKNPDRPMVVFAITNGTESPIPFSRLDIHVATVNASTGNASLTVSCGYGGVSLTTILKVKHVTYKETALSPGATLTVAMPVGPHCGGDVYGPRPADGFLVHVSSDGSGALVADPVEAAFLRTAFEQLRSQAQQQ
jgi:hypothetical protein